MSYKYEIHGKGDPDGYYVSNGLRFATPEEAEHYGHDLESRWYGMDDGRVAESPDPVTHRWDAEIWKAIPVCGGV